MCQEHSNRTTPPTVTSWRSTKSLPLTKLSSNTSSISATSKSWSWLKCYLPFLGYNSSLTLLNLPWQLTSIKDAFQVFSPLLVSTSPFCFTSALVKWSQEPKSVESASLSCVSFSWLLTRSRSVILMISTLQKKSVSMAAWLYYAVLLRLFSGLLSLIIYAKW